MGFVVATALLAQLPKPSTRTLGLATTRALAFCGVTLRAHDLQGVRAQETRTSESKHMSRATLPSRFLVASSPGRLSTRTRKTASLLNGLPSAQDSSH